MEQRPSGWYDDPDDPTLLRYWDGILWSDRTMPKVKPGLDRSSIGTPPPPSAQQEPVGQWPAPHQQQPWPGMPQRPGPQSRQVARTPDGAELSGWWRRVFAQIIDNLITFTIAIPLGWVWFQPWVRGYLDWTDQVMSQAGKGGRMPAQPDDLLVFPWQVIVIAAVVAMVYDVVLTHTTGRTVGKLATGIRVRSEASPAPPSWGHAGIRSLVKLGTNLLGAVPVLSFVAAIAQLVDYLWPLHDPKRQAWHDKFAKTYVVRGDPPRSVR
ncbi:DUF2510 domain-containing protein [Calidifontibacter sp. DB0510]|uniref:DUF2510 domain-containing protein n=1 Tax=Metallococcus carri TaxID=1656884 RepID=A0A967AXZ1_9MICO|nr:RDD family protein [Metallococcus carri]NHN54502.1 DUF2510 domain-containing protein [Metallococcus carri]NOP36659.1 DUF2510 domain-containing protein [Calidifontibacter sp. DB2511S]